MGDLNFNIFNVIILAGIIHGLIFSVVLCTNKRLKSRTNNYLALTILSLAFSNLQYWFIDTNIIPRFKYDNDLIIFIPFEFLMLPFFFLFIKSYLDEAIKKLTKSYLFIPFVLCCVYLIVENILTIKLSLVKIMNLIVEYISIIFSVLIIGLVFKSLIRYEKKHSKSNKNQLTIKTKWIKRILYIGLALCSLWFISLNFSDTLFGKGYYKFYPLWIGISILIYWLGYTAVLQKQLFNERKQLRVQKHTTAHEAKKLSAYSKIDALIINRKLHLNPSLSLKLLSDELNLSEGYISQLISKNSSLGFNDFINSLRVQDAKQMLANKTYNSYTITAIGLEAGFNSKSSFYSVFKKFTGKTPLEFKKSVQNI